VIGIVVVSHSQRVARGIADIATDMVDDGVNVFPVGGDPDGGIGTSPDCIEGTLREAADRVDKLLVVVDLGSARINTEVALEQSGIDARIVDCPVVEGALSAAIEAATGDATHESVANAAEEAWQISKQSDS